MTDLENLDKPELRELAREHDLHVDFRRSLPDVRAAIAEGLAAKAEGGDAADPTGAPEGGLEAGGGGDVELDGEDDPGDGGDEGGVAAAEQPEYFRVLRKSAVADEGYVYTLPQGTVISTLTHDVGALIRQGVPLEQVSGPLPAPAPW